jgi:translation initiation factor 1
MPWVFSTDGVAPCVRLETQGGKGKGVTVVTGLPLSGAELAVLCKSLKQRMGTGGTVKNGATRITGE